MDLDLKKRTISSDVQRADNNSNTRREVGDEGRCVIAVKGHVNHSKIHNPHPHWCTVWTDKRGWTHTYHGDAVVLTGSFIVRNQPQPEVFQLQHLRTFILGMLHNAVLGSARSPPERASWEDKRKVRGWRSTANAGTFSVELRSLRKTAVSPSSRRTLAQILSHRAGPVWHVLEGGQKKYKLINMSETMSLYNLSTDWLDFNKGVAQCGDCRMW